MSHSPIQPGNIVQLKSGGPQMTVASIIEGEAGVEAMCIWHVEEQQQEESFNVDSLEVLDITED